MPSFDDATMDRWHRDFITRSILSKEPLNDNQRTALEQELEKVNHFLSMVETQKIFKAQLSERLSKP